MALPLWLRRLLGLVNPPPPTPPPPPVVGPTPPGGLNASRQSLLAEANSLRGAKGLPPFVHDDRLAAVGQPQAEALATGRSAWPAGAHDGFSQRLAASGFPFTSPVAEGVAPGSGAAAMQVLLSGGPGEAHYDDFYRPAFNRIGFGAASGPAGAFLVVDYGTL